MENHRHHFHQARLHQRIFENDALTLFESASLPWTIRWRWVAGSTCTIRHTRLHTQWRTICLKWENNEPQGISMKFISCTVPQAAGRWGPPLCTYFHKSSCVMTLPRCKWTGWGQRTERLDWWRPFLVRKKTKQTKTTCGVHVKKQFLASRGSNIKQNQSRRKKDLLADSQMARRPLADRRREWKV